jgi:hypothetical protein
MRARALAIIPVLAQRVEVSVDETWTIAAFMAARGGGAARAFLHGVELRPLSKRGFCSTGAPPAGSLSVTELRLMDYCVKPGASIVLYFTNRPDGAGDVTELIKVCIARTGVYVRERRTCLKLCVTLCVRECAFCV